MDESLGTQGQAEVWRRLVTPHSVCSRQSCPLGPKGTQQENASVAGEGARQAWLSLASRKPQDLVGGIFEATLPAVALLQAAIAGDTSVAHLSNRSRVSECSEPGLCD